MAVHIFLQRKQKAHPFFLSRKSGWAPGSKLRKFTEIKRFDTGFLPVISHYLPEINKSRYLRFKLAPTISGRIFH
jgi:hypothetical protein